MYGSGMNMRVFPDVGSDSARLALQRLAGPGVGEFEQGQFSKPRSKSYSPFSAETFMLLLYVFAFLAFLAWQNHGLKPITDMAHQVVALCTSLL